VEYCKNKGIELIAIATHGRSGPGRVVIGSVADHVVRHCGIPILLIRPTIVK
jgi:nucleotide-binding universal stress UspA family protein